MLHDAQNLPSQTLTVFGLLGIVGFYFAKVAIGLVLTYVAWLYVSAYIEPAGFPLTLILATFLLTLASVGIGIYLLKPENIILPINFLWFAACGSIAFNLYQIHTSITGGLNDST
jgi:hypothetical protein